MSYPVLALFTRSLREESRSRFTYAARFALGAIILLFLWFTSKTAGWVGAPGLSAFTSIIGINLFCITVGGLGYFASAITEEKEEQTLPLLRMTNLNAVSILLGKSTGRVLGAVLLLVAQIPFTLLAVSLGGVSVPQVLAAYLALLAYTVLLSNVALFFSVISPKTSVAALLTAGMLFLLFMGPVVYGGCRDLLTRVGWVADGSVLFAALDPVVAVIKANSPFTRIAEIFGTGFDGPVVGFQAIGNLVLAAVFFLLGWWQFEPASRRVLGGRGGRLRIVPSARTRRVGERRARRRALFWKDFQLFLGGWRFMIAKSVVLVFVAIAISLLIQRSNPRIPTRPIIGGFVAGTMLMLAYVEVGLQLSRIFRLEVRWQTLSGLAMLPVTIRQIAYEKVLVVFVGALPALILSGGAFTMTLPEIMESNFRGVGGVTMGVFYSVANSVFLLHIIAFLSVVMKRGGLAVSLIGWYLCMAVSSVMFAISGGVGGFVAQGVIALIASLALHLGTLRRLETLAASD